MTKTQAIGLFRTGKALADALGITPSAVYQWPEDLPPRLADEIVGAALRCRLVSPERAAEWLGADPEESAETAPLAAALVRSG